jgi:hypothetical protein
MVEKFRVFMFHDTGTNQEETLEPVGAEEAVLKAKRLIDSIPCKTGTINRVMITDLGDIAVFDWVFGKGIVFPPPPPEAK